jgi:hypothetical protein
MFTLVRLKKGGDPHVVLGMARSLRRPFTVDDLRRLAPARLNSDKRARSALNALHRKDLLHRVDADHWQITIRGVTQLALLANREY